MRAVIQRVHSTALSVDGKIISEIGRGLAVYLGIAAGDSYNQAEFMAKKIANMRLMEDTNGKMNLSVLDLGLEILLISQFTLCADVSQGNRPSFTLAEAPAAAKAMFEFVAEKLAALNVKVKTGIFGADMQIMQHNDGPVTIILEG